MNRRHFLASAGWLLPTAVSRFGFSGLLLYGSPLAVSVRLDLTRSVATVPRDFLGLGYEISSVARPGLLSDHNSAYVRLLRTLANHGVIRVGGNTSDYASYSAAGPPVSSPEGKTGSVVDDRVLRDFGRFLDATGWQLIWGLNLGGGNLENAILEARAVTGATRDHLLAFEIGNEPDLFSRAHRQPYYRYDEYLREFRIFRDALRKSVPDISFAGPDVASQTPWVRKFATDEGKNIKLLTQHYYRDGARNPNSTIDELLRADPRLTTMLVQLAAISESSGVPYRICETNSFSGGGKPGVSDTFAAALWVLDFLFTLATAGCAGVNMETGVNQLGFISSYSVIGDDEQGHYWAAPEYYGMLAFAEAAAGQILGCRVEGTGADIKVYATQPDRNHVVLTGINKDRSSDATLVLERDLSSSFRAGSAIRLMGPSLESKSGITLGGATVSEAGSWEPVQIEPVAKTEGQWQVSLPRASAVIANLHT
jgi:hypothetical protein